MTWMLNGIAWADPGRPAKAAEHERVTAAGLCALVSKAEGFVAGKALDPTRLDEPVVRALRKHDALLQAYANKQDVLPMRFGLCLATPDAARTILLRHHEPCLRCLQDLAGHREYAVRVHRRKSPEQSPAPTGPARGRSLLAGRLAEREGTERHRHAIRHFLLRTQVAMEDFGALTALPKVPTTNPRLAGWACLIRPGRIEGAREMIAALDDDAKALGLTVTVTGPHAPFSFATLQIGQKGETA